MRSLLDHQHRGGRVADDVVDCGADEVVPEMIEARDACHNQSATSRLGCIDNYGWRRADRRYDTDIGLGVGQGGPDGLLG